MRYLILILLLLSSTAQAQHPPITHDKDKHFAAGLVLGTYDWKLGCAAGIAKELYDKNQGGVADVEDFAFTCAGASVGELLNGSREALPHVAGMFLVADWLQTRDIATNPTYTETNRFLGEHPSIQAVNMHFAAVLGIHIAVNKYASRESKAIWNWAMLFVEAKVVLHNRRLGVSFKF